MYHLTSEDVHASLPWRKVVDALRAAHQRPSKPMDNTAIFDAPEGGGDQFVNLTAWSQNAAIAVKMVGVFPKNPALDPPEPSVQGLVALFDGKTGAPLMTCDGAAITYRKTAADSALGVDLLARPDSSVLAVAGAGGLSPYVIEAICAVRPIRRVLVWNRNLDNARAMVLQLNLPGIEIKVVEDFDLAVSQADIVSTVTMARSPILRGAALKAGTHVDLIGAYLPTMREADAEVVRRAGRIFADARKTFDISADGSGPIAEGLISGPEADYFDLCSGLHKGRITAQEITVCKNSGGAHLDMFVAEYLHARRGLK